MFSAVADSALHDTAGSVLGVLAAAETFSAGAASASFTSFIEVGQGVVTCPHESTRLPFVLSIHLLDAMDVPPELADGFACEASPRPRCFAALHVDVFPGFCL